MMQPERAVVLHIPNARFVGPRKLDPLWVPRRKRYHRRNEGTA